MKTPNLYLTSEISLFKFDSQENLSKKFRKKVLEVFGSK